MVDLLNNSYLQWSYGIRLHSALVCKRATGPFWKHGSSPPNFFNAALKVNWSERVMWDCWLMIYASSLCSSPGFSAAKSSACSTGDTTRTSQPPAAPRSPSATRALATPTQAQGLKAAPLLLCCAERLVGGLRGKCRRCTPHYCCRKLKTALMRRASVQYGLGGGTSSHVPQGIGPKSSICHLWQLISYSIQNLCFK